MDESISKKNLEIIIIMVASNGPEFEGKLEYHLEEYLKRYRPKSLINRMIDTPLLEDDRLVEIQDAYGLFDYTDYYSYRTMVKNDRVKLASIVYEKKDEFPSPEKLKEKLDRSERNYEASYARHIKDALSKRMRRLNMKRECRFQDRIELLEEDEFIHDLSKLLSEYQLNYLIEVVAANIIRREYNTRRGKSDRYAMIDTITRILTGQIYTSYPNPINEQRILERLERDMKL